MTMTPRTTLVTRLAWLRARPEVWAELTDAQDSADYQYRKRAIIKVMRLAGLYSESTNDCDICITGLVRRLREERVDRAALGLPT